MRDVWGKNKIFGLSIELHFLEAEEKCNLQICGFLWKNIDSYSNDTITFLTLPHLQVQDGRGRAEDCLQHPAPDPGDAQPHQRQAHQRHGQSRQVRGKLTKL